MKTLKPFYKTLGVAAVAAAFAVQPAAATEYVKQEVQRFKKLAVELGLTAQ